MFRFLSYLLFTSLFSVQLLFANPIVELTRNDAFNQALRVIKEDPTTSIGVIQQLAIDGFVDAQAQLAYYYMQGMYVRQNYQVGLSWYRKAASQRDGASANNIALAYAYGKGVVQDRVKAVQWLEKAVEYGYINSKKRIEVINSMFDGPKLYGLTLFSATRKTMREVLNDKGIVAKRTSNKYYTDLYDPSRIIPGASLLKTGFTGEGQLATVEIEFDNDSEKNQRFESLSKFLSKQYGNPSLIKPNGEALWKQHGVNIHLSSMLKANRTHLIYEVVHARQMVRQQIESSKIENLQASLITK